MRRPERAFQAAGQSPVWMGCKPVLGSVPVCLYVFDGFHFRIGSLMLTRYTVYSTLAKMYELLWFGVILQSVTNLKCKLITEVYSGLL